MAWNTLEITFAKFQLDICWFNPSISTQIPSDIFPPKKQKDADKRISNWLIVQNQAIKPPKKLFYMTWNTLDITCGKFE